MKPVHPILVHFPLALLPVSAGADLVGFFAAVPSLSHTGAWTMFAAALAAVPTVAAGWYDMSRAPLSESVHRRVHRHRAVGFVLCAAILGLAIWRGWLWVDGAVVPMFYLDLAVLTTALAAFQGWLGGELVYREGVFVQVPEDAAPPTDPGGSPAADSGASPGHSNHH